MRLREFAASPERDDDDDVPDQLLILANRWWNATDRQPQIEHVLNSLGRIPMRAQEFVAEINYPDELNVSDALQQHFIRRGYQVAGEGRDQIAFESPRGTVVKVVGLGDTHREDVVRQYVKFFMANQRNPYYPRIYNTGEFPVGDETYFVYEQEYLTYISDEEEVLEYIEDLMKAVPRGEQAIHAFQQNRPLPKSLDPGEVDGLVMATQDLEDHLGGAASLDLSMIENIRRRNNGHLVIMDPYSL